MLNFFSYNVAIDVNMLCALVEDMVGSDLNSGLVITVEKSWLCEVDAEVTKEVGQLLELHVVEVSARYSASEELCETVCCSLDLQEMMELQDRWRSQ